LGEPASSSSLFTKVDTGCRMELGQFYPHQLLRVIHTLIFSIWPLKSHVSAEAGALFIMIAHCRIVLSCSSIKGLCFHCRVLLPRAFPVKNVITVIGWIVKGYIFIAKFSVNTDGYP
jgi:hypothetical protein